MALLRRHAIGWSGVVAMGAFVMFPMSIGSAITGTMRSESTAIDSLRDQIISLSGQVPPELGAYATLQLVRLGLIDKASEQQSTLLSAFSLAGQSPFSIRRTLIYGNADSRSGYASDAMSLNLDTLSLRSEIVIAMLGSDRALARQLFAQMGPPAVPRLTCSGSLIPDPAPYFQAAAQIYQRGFSPAQRVTGEDVDFLNNVLLGITSGSELHNALSMLYTLRLKPYVRQGAEISLGHAISQIRSDPRTFSATLLPFVEDLAVGAAPNDSGEFALLSAARGYIVSNASDAACIDEIWHAKPGGNDAPAIALAVDPGAFAELNVLLAAYGISSISASELAPRSVLDQKEDTGPLYWQDPTSRSVEEEYKRLRFAADHDSDLWQAQADLFLQHMRDWAEPQNPDDAEGVLVEKAILYSGFLDAVPLDSPLLQPSIIDYLGFLSQPPPQATDEIFILWDINRLFQSPRLATESPRFRNALASAIQAAPNPTVALWAALLRLSRVSGSAGTN